MSVTHYLPLTVPYALALVTGQVDTIPLHAEPWDALGTRIAIVGMEWHSATAQNLVQFDRVKFDRRDMLRTGRLGSVVVAGWVRRDGLFDRKATSGAYWPKRPVPWRGASVVWRVEAPKVELGQTVTGLTRLLVSHWDRPETIASVREYGDRFGRSALPDDCRSVYDGSKG